MNKPKCYDCKYYLLEKYQLPKCKRKTEKLWNSDQRVFVFCEDERHFEIGECGELGNYFEPLEPSIEQLETIFDGATDTKPKTPPTIFKENEGIF